jgi:hypothetical protein
LGWQLIEHDPLLRLELTTIEQHAADDQMVAELIELFSRAERMMRLTAVIIRDDCRPPTALWETQYAETQYAETQLCVST